MSARDAEPRSTRIGTVRFDRAEVVAQLTRADAPLGRWMAKIGPFTLKPERAPSPFAALAQSIVYQQLNGKAAGTIFGRVQAACAVAGGLSPEIVLALPEETLRTAGLSRAKLLALRDLAARSLDGTIPSLAVLRRMADEAVVERLIQVRGVGRWTAEMFLIFRLGRPDVLPLGDYGVRKGFSRVFRMPALATPDEMERRGERWRPFRTVASWYLWRALEAP